MNNKFIFRYLSEQSHLIIYLIFFLLIFILTTLLFKINISIILYLVIIFIFLTLIYFTIDYFKKEKSYKNLQIIESLDFKEIKQHLDLIQFSSIEAQELNKLINQYNNAINESIHLAHKRLNQTNEYITTWIHQIKLPITSMYLILNKEDSQLARELKQDLFRIELYIDMILTYFRLESTTSDYVFTKIDLFNLVKKEIKKFRNEFIMRGIGINLIPFDNQVINDEKWLSFILDQIISNSLKYTTNGKITISFKDDFLMIKDTGIGISKSNLPRIFERGYTGFNGRLNEKSSGLGLYLVKRICDNLNIPIKIISEENKGTTVLLTLKSETFNKLNKLT